MRIGRDTSLRDVAFEVCTALESAGTTAVLTGGGAATLYAPAAIQSFDLDFVCTLHRSGAPARALEALGYRLSGQHYQHVESRFLLEFPPGPLAIGAELITGWDTLREGNRVLNVLTPTDSCRDRLAAFYHFRDRSSLEQAVAVFAAQAQRIETDVLRQWSQREAKVIQFEEFLREAGA